MTFPILETARLRLIEVRAEHASTVFDIFSNPQVTKYYGMDSFTEVGQAEKMVQHFRSTYEAKKGIRWAIIIGDDNRFVGTIGLNNLALGMKKAEIGFEIHPEYWRSGVTSEALRAVLSYSFETLGLHRMGAVTFPANTASIGLLKKHGFKQEGKLRSYLYQNGQSHDASLFSLLHTEWASND
ncbi:GNAT family N-acetyltransferase [Sporosarcina limicola]|uniref:Ribosomal-protein-alanine N-acetyltransferase n=1 Tax=Sporosarcina limicola TaxID=34101 RepID=A0A927RFE4_9BACL|nr:GNAT family protein [Sporosarcina limicola]MBE1555437.1 ribosomal-protein-alanine N-acetyltransferase [Sporosarcina limicola]